MGLFDNDIYTIRTPQQAELFLDQLSDSDFYLLYNDWIGQIWLYENEPLTTEEELNKFSYFQHASAFKKAFINGDYKRINFGAGFTLEEGALKYAMEIGMLTISILSELAPDRTEIAMCTVLPNVLLMNSFLIYLTSWIAPFNSDQPDKAIWTFPTYVVDGQLCHIIHVRGMSNDRKFVIYDEFWWKGNKGKSFFSQGENSKKTSAELIDPKWRTFKVPLWDFWTFFVGFIMPRSGLQNWTYAVLQTQKLLEKNFPHVKSYDPFSVFNK